MGRVSTASGRAWEILVRTCWSGEPVAHVSDDDLASALALARRNEVEPQFVRAYSGRLAAAMAEIEDEVGAFRANLDDVCRRLTEAGVRPILIKALPDEDYTYSNFDVVVGDDGWQAAVEALGAWAVSTERHPLERGTKMLFYPPAGPAAHLHREVAWFDIPAIPTSGLRARARMPATGCCLMPSPVDAFRILLAHTVFQNLALTLGELMTYRDLARRIDRREASERAEAEGWGIGFRGADATARRAIRRLDAMESVGLPVPLPVASSVIGGVQHALFMASTGRWQAAAREVALRGPLVVAKRRRVRLARG